MKQAIEGILTVFREIDLVGRTLLLGETNHTTRIMSEGRLVRFKGGNSFGGAHFVVIDLRSCLELWELRPAPSPNTQLFLPSGVAVTGIDSWVSRFKLLWIK